MIRQEISQILGFTISENEWDKYFIQLDKEGRITKRHLIKIILFLLKREESRENG